MPSLFTNILERAANTECTADVVSLQTGDVSLYIDRSGLQTGNFRVSMRAHHVSLGNNATLKQELFVLLTLIQYGQ